MYEGFDAREPEYGKERLAGDLWLRPPISPLVVSSSASVRSVTIAGTRGRFCATAGDQSCLASDGCTRDVVARLMHRVAASLVDIESVQNETRFDHYRDLPIPCWPAPQDAARHSTRLRAGALNFSSGRSGPGRDYWAKLFNVSIHHEKTNDDATVAMAFRSSADCHSQLDTGASAPATAVNIA